MINWFKNRNKKISISVKGVNPQTENEFKFYEFVSKEPVLTLREWYKETKRQNIPFRIDYENAIIEKIKKGIFYNPINFREYFGLDFDFIAIDFETANEKRTSACALGIVFVKNDKIVNEELYYIKPPSNQIFKPRYVNIHGITQNDVDDYENFDYYWNNGLNEYFNNNLIVFHNASMDLSILKQLFALYNITDYDIAYLDTMNLASYLGLPKKIIELAEMFEIEIINHHNPLEDAKLCAHIFALLSEKDFDYNKIIYKLSFQDYLNEYQEYSKFLAKEKETYSNCDEIIKRYLVDSSEIQEIVFSDNAFLFTGDLRIHRDEAQEIVRGLGGLIKNSVSSKVDYVVLGSGYGWSKVEKVACLNTDKGLNIRFISEEVFTELTKNAL